MKSPAQKKPEKNSLQLMTMIIAAGFCLMLFFSLVAYRIESLYIRALETKIASQQGRIDELIKLSQQMDQQKITPLRK